MPRVKPGGETKASAVPTAPAGMICQRCLSKTATWRIIERSPSGRIDRIHFCVDCYEVTCFEPPPARPFPLPRITLNTVMIVIAVFAVSNAIAAAVMRNLVFGTAEQLRDWTVRAFVALNLVLAFFVLWFGLIYWLGRVSWYKRTGNLLPRPRAPKLSRRQYLAVVVRIMPLLAWMLAAQFLHLWLTPKLWPMQRVSLPLLYLLLCGPSLLLFAWTFSRNHALQEHLRKEWRTSSGLERALKAMIFAWSIGFVAAIGFGGPNLLGWGFTTWFPIPRVILIGIAVQLGLGAATAFATRRR